MECIPENLEAIIASYDGSQSHVFISYEDLLYLQLHDKLHYFSEALGAIANRFVYVLVEFEGTVQFMHVTDIDNFKSIRENGLKLEYCYPAEGQSSIAGIYAVRQDCPYGIIGLQTVLMDMFQDSDGMSPLVCTGVYTGKYHLVVNSTSYNYLILAQDTPVDKFYLLLESRFLPVQSIEEITSLLSQRSKAPIL